YGGKHMKKQWTGVFVLAFAAIACDPTQSNLNDTLDATARVFYKDGVTPLANFGLDSYKITFSLKNGASVVKEYKSVTTDAQGVYHDLAQDVGLSTTETYNSCYDTCVSWNNDCGYDQYSQYSCYNYCTVAARDCYKDDYSEKKNFTEVVSAV